MIENKGRERERDRDVKVDGTGNVEVRGVLRSSWCFYRLLVPWDWLKSRRLISTNEHPVLGLLRRDAAEKGPRPVVDKFSLERLEE